MSPTETLGIGLLMLSAVLMLLELKTAGLGAFGAGAVVALVAGAWLLVGSSAVALPIVLVAALPVVALLAFLAVLAHRARRHKVVTGEAGMIGLEGKAETDLLPDGKVLVRGELWSAWSPVRLERGDAVRVTGVRGLRLEVADATGRRAAPAPVSVVVSDEDESQ
jgi:membrane-bound serine protease (ClpP class)